jgi:hypothetical protein
MLDSQLSKNIRYYGIFQILCVGTFILLSSIGAFFHFLLNHEISIVESWLHNNHWEIIILSKLISLLIMNRWFRICLYQVKSLRQLFRELLHWPDHRAVVISVFMLISYLSLTGAKTTAPNMSYLYYHMTSFAGLFLFFGIEFVVIAYLKDIFDPHHEAPFKVLSFFYALLFIVSFRLCVPDYYDLLSYVTFCFLTLIFLSGKEFKNWSNVVCFLVLFVAPMGSIFGLDPIWGDDFSPFPVNSKLALPFLVVIWVISFSYYKYRNQILSGARKLLR